MKALKLTNSEQKILNLLKEGKENAIRRETLIEKTGMADRTVRENIRSMRLKGIEIMSLSSCAGYWLPVSYEDKREYFDQMNSRGRSCMSVIKTVRKDLKRGKNQISIFEGI